MRAIRGGTSGGEHLVPGLAGEGTPALACSYLTPGPATGVCENVMDDTEEGYETVIAWADPAPGSEFAEWVTNEGAAELCEGALVDPETGGIGCLAYSEPPGSGGTELTAVFLCEIPGECEEEPPAEQPLTFNINEGEGTVVSDPAGLECTGSEGESCEASFEEGAEVTLTASPAAGYRFYTWQNCPPEGYEGRTCTVEMNEATEVGVKFKKTSALTVSKAEGSEPGIIKSDPGGAICFFPCDTATIAFDEGKEVTVFTKAPNHRHFVEFTGGTGQTEACNGETSCAFTANGTDSSIEALFAEDEQATLSVNKAGGGQAKITIQPANVVCVNTCSATTAEFYAEPEAEEATVEWDLAKGTSSIEWTTGAGTCTGSSEADKGECTVTMDEAHELVAALE